MADTDVNEDLLDYEEEENTEQVIIQFFAINLFKLAVIEDWRGYQEWSRS